MGPVGDFLKTYPLEVDFDYLLNGFSEKTIILVGIYNQQFQGTIILMVFDLQGTPGTYTSSLTNSLCFGIPTSSGTLGMPCRV